MTRAVPPPSIPELFAALLGADARDARDRCLEPLAHALEPKSLGFLAKAGFRDRYLQEEAFQLALVRLQADPASFGPPPAFVGRWFRTLGNLAIDHVRMADTRARYEAVAGEQRWAALEAESADEAASRREREARLAEALASVSELARIAITYLCFDECSRKRFARLLGLSERKVRELERRSLDELVSSLGSVPGCVDSFEHDGPATTRTVHDDDVHRYEWRKPA